MFAEVHFSSVRATLLAFTMVQVDIAKSFRYQRLVIQLFVMLETSVGKFHVRRETMLSRALMIVPINNPL